MVCECHGRRLRFGSEAAPAGAGFSRTGATGGEAARAGEKVRLTPRRELPKSINAQVGKGTRSGGG